MVHFARMTYDVIASANQNDSKSEKDLTVEDSLFNNAGILSIALCEVSEDVFCGLCFTSSGFTANNDGLRFLLHLHVSEGFVG